MLMINIFLTAIALVFVIEGIFPFLCPDCWRNTMAKLILQKNRTLRTTGLISMFMGVALLFLVHHGFL